MILGFGTSLTTLAWGGLILFALLLFQLASGLRWIKLPPKRRLKIHKTAGVALVVVAALHGLMGLVLATGFTIG